MRRSAFVNFLFVLIYRHRSKHVAIYLLGTLLVAFVSAVMITSNTLKTELLASLEAQPDMVIQKLHGGRVVPIPVAWAEEFSQIPGVSIALPRVYGTYFHRPDAEHFRIIGVDLFDVSTNDALAEVIDRIDAKSFLAKPQMIVGSGVKQFLDGHYYLDHYDFMLSDHTRQRVTVFDILADEAALFTNDVILLPQPLARQIVGLDPLMATDIALRIPNPLERETIYTKLIWEHVDIRIIQKEQLEKSYEQLFSIKHGFFLMVLLLSLSAFVLLLYQRYTLIHHAERKEIGILRAVGWSIQAVIWLKLLENSIIIFAAFLSGFILGYLFVALFNAPFLIDLFLGNENLVVQITLHPMVDLGLFFSLFLLFMVPFIAAILLPVWRIAITDPLEAMR
jgi:putative ABC transport system permease protein